VARTARVVRTGFRLTLVSLILSSYGPPAASQDSNRASQLLDLTLEELSNIVITSVSRSAEPLSDAAAAVAVVTDDEIRRSGATSVPEALRLVPGLHVARLSSDRWVIGSRGFSSSNSEKLLVLSDTRSLYTPLFSGVNWDVQDYLLSDIDRIEIIRGPGAALWGSNAVNGVINITTKSAENTQGSYIQTILGTEERVAAARYGGKAGEDFYYRVFGKYSKHEGTHAPDAQSSDEWDLAHVGFRADWQATANDSLTLQGDLYEGGIGQLVPVIRVIGVPGPQGQLEADVSGGNVLARWQRRIDNDSGFTLRAYYDETDRDDPSYEDELETFDIGFQHAFTLGEDQDFLWGLDYRRTESRTGGSELIALDPELSRDELFSAFVQDRITLRETFDLTLGTKIEHNDFSGTEVQPSVRLAWNIGPRRIIWGAVSRAVRVPTRYERDVNAEATPPGANPAVRLLGNEDFDSEKLVAYELGHRWQPHERLSVDLALFHNRYENLNAIEFDGEPFVDPADGRLVVPITRKNVNDGRTQGVEALITFMPLGNWRLTASYAYLDMEIDAGGDDLNRDEFVEGSTPRHQLGLRSSLDLSARVQLEVLFRYLSDIRTIPEITTGEGVSGYSELGIRVARQLGEHMEVSLVGRNLLDDHHAEFGAPMTRGEIERSVSGSIVWSF
jgi:iron complex outermembrane receptor protein